MKHLIEIKNYRSLPATHDFPPFHLRVYVDGKPFAEISDDGWGGEWQIDPIYTDAERCDHDKALAKRKAFDAQMEAIEADLQQIEYEAFGEKQRHTFESYIADLMDRKDIEKDLRAKLRRKPIAICSASKRLLQWKVNPSDAVLDKVEKIIAERTDGEWILLNRLPISKAADLWIAAS